MGIQAAEFITGPLRQGVMHGWINSQQNLLAIAHRLRVERPGVDDR